MPAEGTLYVSRPLSDLSLAYTQSDSIIDGPFPLRVVMKKKGSVYILRPDNLRKVNTGPRAPHEPSERSHWTAEPHKFELERHSLHDLIDLNEQQYNMDDVLNAEEAATLTMTEQIAISAELDARDKCFVPSVFPSGYTGTPATKWDASGGDPIGDINDASEKCLLGCGRRANAIVIAGNVWTKLISLEPIVDRFKNVITGDVTRALFASLFEWLDPMNIFIGDMTLDDGEEKADGTYDARSFIWQNNVLVFRRETAMVNAQMKTPMPIGFGRRFQYERNRYVRKWMVEDPETQKILVADDWDHNVTESKAGYLITSPLTT